MYTFLLYIWCSEGFKWSVNVRQGYPLPIIPHYPLLRTEWKLPFSVAIVSQNNHFWKTKLPWAARASLFPESSQEEGVHWRHCPSIHHRLLLWAVKNGPKSSSKLSIYWKKRLQSICLSKCSPSWFPSVKSLAISSFRFGTSIIPSLMAHLFQMSHGSFIAELSQQGPTFKDIFHLYCFDIFMQCLK